jgi:alkylation response protein AidB-like acyl-CoA dehydrogenase
MSTTARTTSNEPHLASPDVNPSFTKSVFAGELREDLLFPFPTLSAEERETLRLVIDSFRAFAAEHVDSSRFDHDGEFPRDTLRALHELGVMGLSIPEAYGGFGASSQVYCRFFGEVAATDPALCVYLGAHQSIGCKGIVLFGSEEQKQRYLPRCSSGEVVAAFCLTEPGSGSDAQAMKTTATVSDDGSHYLLSGTKIWISNAAYADILTVFAKVAVDVDGTTKQRVTAFIVDAHAAGVSLGKREEKMGIKASDTRAVFFDKVKVPVEDRLGGVGHGFRIALEILNSGRLGLAAGSSFGARRIMSEAITYARQREQFGRPIASFEMIQRKIATTAAELYAADAGVAVAAGMVDRGGVDFSLETAACKVFVSDLAFRAANDALQIAGGIGYSKEFPYEQAVRDSRINRSWDFNNPASDSKPSATRSRIRFTRSARSATTSLGARSARSRRQASPKSIRCSSAKPRWLRGWCTTSHSVSKTYCSNIVRKSSTNSFFKSGWPTPRSTSFSRQRCCPARHRSSRSWARWARAPNSTARVCSCRWRIDARGGTFGASDAIRTPGCRRSLSAPSKRATPRRRRPPTPK